jgi:hypothetical protein
MADKNELRRLTRALERIASALETVVDRKKRTLRMVDVERGKVYKTHLGKSLRTK